uniref:Uncharacterized protein n=1 Tax=Chromera velia CCMP2878 TaxID=1169474 RepID=A0A0G4GGI4_9ALVE|eukprot:Cvel_21799.t1-p1 / transcript=Cvel_21799.t1 / gene=Cvel_21799 / organism=Chromera_velia_CCMP2878 / gene_product=hypothetical protein / transcript_product=hypothetical protein / location=Cvel_scaffold2076:24600-24875(+) / protein_length=92 / sequence_SO=supercontig / SO=protein_coding / is_pseudo=false
MYKERGQKSALDGKRGRRVATDLLRDRVGHTAAAASSLAGAGKFLTNREGQGGGYGRREGMGRGREEEWGGEGEGKEIKGEERGTGRGGQGE